MPTVIVPAHNEGSTIGQCLTSLLAGTSPHEFDLIVACNGCVDDTADQARSFASSTNNVVVLELGEASKIAALNAAIDAATRLPLIFVDADVQFSADGVRSLHAALAHGPALAAAPAIQLDLHHANWVSRSYHRYWAHLPSIVHGLAGRGVYALSADGLARLERFPNIIADDRYVHSMFVGDERAVLPHISSTVAVARTGVDIVQRKARVFAGNREIDRVVGHGDAGSWTDVIRSDPRFLRDLPVYLGLNVAAKLKALRTVGWNRDESSRSTT